MKVAGNDFVLMIKLGTFTLEKRDSVAVAGPVLHGHSPLNSVYDCLYMHHAALLSFFVRM